MTDFSLSVFLRNPDVVLRDEGPDGALLFNPDTNRVLVINPTGLAIWQLCDGTHRLPDLVSALQQSFAAVPGDQVARQVQEYLAVLNSAGFVGPLET